MFEMYKSQHVHTQTRTTYLKTGRVSSQASVMHVLKEILMSCFESDTGAQQLVRGHTRHGGLILSAWVGKGGGGCYFRWHSFTSVFAVV